MLSRLAFSRLQPSAKTGVLQAFLVCSPRPLTASGGAVRFLSASPHVLAASAATPPSPPPVQAEDPERDLVNFPRRKLELYPPPYRLGFLPEDWFTRFHPKTGVTGGYMLLVSFTTYLVSKEIWVLEHDFYVGCAMFIFLATVVRQVGPDFTKWVNAGLDEQDKKLKAIRQDEIDRCKDAIAEEEKSQWMASSYEALIEAKKENVALQLEAAYRERLQEAYEQVKTRLDYQLEVANVMRRVEQRHMVDWILGNVRKSITAKQEDDALRKCIADLKGLAAAAK